jgi:hypothetical protein
MAGSRLPWKILEWNQNEHKEREDAKRDGQME